jgi:hypothetical protein
MVGMIDSLLKGSCRNHSRSKFDRRVFISAHNLRYHDRNTVLFFERREPRRHM